MINVRLTYFVFDTQTTSSKGAAASPASQALLPAATVGKDWELLFALFGGMFPNLWFRTNIRDKLRTFQGKHRRLSRVDAKLCVDAVWSLLATTGRPKQQGVSGVLNRGSHLSDEHSTATQERHIRIN